jgi:hypothetical protein
MPNEASRSEFYEEWRICLREHYLHVVKSGDEITEPTLRAVLLETGFSEGEIADFYDKGLRLREAESPTD